MWDKDIKNDHTDVVVADDAVVVVVFVVVVVVAACELKTKQP